MTTLSPKDARQIAKEAYVYGFPLVDNYRVNHSYFVDRKGPEFKAPWNQLNNTARVFTPDDKAIQTANSDTPYSQLGTDLRAEPLVLTIPPIEKNRYFSVQLIDVYTYNFDYIGTRTTGNGGGNYLLAGPGWKGEVPEGHREGVPLGDGARLGVLPHAALRPVRHRGREEGAGRLQGADAVAVPGQAAPTRRAPDRLRRAPLARRSSARRPTFFDVLAFVLGFCPTHPSEVALRERFARLGIEGGKPFDPARLSPEILQAVKDGMADAWAEFDGLQGPRDRHRQGAVRGLFGTREHLKNDYLFRMAGAVLGIYGNSKEEAIYPIYVVDAEGEPLDASKKTYTLRFPPGALPPVDAFWSLTLYELPSKLCTRTR